MLLIPKREDRLDRLAEKLRTAESATPHLVAETVSDACPRLSLLNKSGTVAAQLNRLIEASAWTDLALALIGLELPGWKLRRLVQEDGTWFCSLSRQPNVPVDLDDSADASHEDLALAILSAFAEARRGSAACKVGVQMVPRVHTVQGNPLCCDNFA